MKSTIASRTFYHIYPLGMCGAPARNDFSSPAGNGLKQLASRIPHLVSLGINAVYLGPLFESTAHGYDTVDYLHVDRRLGTNADLTALVRAMHENGISVVLDAVLNHTGRDFFAFKDLQSRGAASPYRNWYLNVDFCKRSPEGDNFSYEGWAGHFSLAKLNTANPSVREHLFGAIKFWIDEFGIDGLRLDAADVLAPDFMDAMSHFIRSVKPDFWLMGEVVHGDYRNWARPGRLDSVTNYEVYKGLWSSFNDGNFFEVAWALNRQSGPEGIYRDTLLYNFADNHDVNRVASILKNQGHLFPLYGMLFTIPGVPSVYYGSEWGVRGERQKGSDANLRPAIIETADHGRHAGLPGACIPRVDSAALEDFIRRLAGIRTRHAALQSGSYLQLQVASCQFAYLRESAGEKIVVAVNSGTEPVSLRVPLTPCGLSGDRYWRDLLDETGTFRSSGSGANQCMDVSLGPNQIRILALQ